MSKHAQLCKKIEAAGFEAYFVGGSVRDTILGNTIHDVDIASSAYPNEIKQIFNRTVDTGIEHGTVMVLEHGEGYEITTFRTESGYQDFRRPDSVTFVRSLTEDLQRRDFTINALAMRENGEIIDLFSGLKDLKNGVIKAVGDPQQRFHEDALRMMRAARFASQLDFTIEAKTMAGIKANASLLTKIAVERIRVELEKLFLGQNPTSGIEVFVNTKLYQYCPMLAPFEIDLRQLATLEKWDLSLPSEVWALLAYTFYLHGKQINQFLKAWKTSNQVIIDTVQVVAAINEISEEVLTAKMLYQTGKERLISANKIALLFGGELTTDDILKRYDELPIKHKNELELNGKQLLQEANLRPGPIIGKILQRLEQDVVENKIENRHDLLIEAAKEMVKEG